jgi:hypothetical protein
MKFNFKKFGEAIKLKRTDGKTTHDKPYSIKALSIHLGILYTTIFRIEIGRSINSEDLVILGKWAGLDLYDFLENS